MVRNRGHHWQVKVYAGRDPLQGPQVGVEPVGLGARQQGLLDLGRLGIRQLGVRAGRA